MIVMGIDGSTTSSGWAIFESTSCKRLDSGRVQFNDKDWRERIFKEWQVFNEIIQKYCPDIIYMEDVPLMGTQKQTFVILGAVQGFILGIATSMNIEISFLLPSQWRSLMGLYDGSRQGTKKEMMKEKAVKMANKIFQLDLVWAEEKVSKIKMILQKVSSLPIHK